MSNPLMRVMFNNTINRPSIKAQAQKEIASTSNLRGEQEKLLKEILTKPKGEIVNKEIKMLTLEELKRDYKKAEPIEEKSQASVSNKNLVSLVSVGKLYRGVK